MSTIKSSTTTTTAYQVVADTTGALVIQTGATPTTAVTIDTSQNVGIGTASPTYKLDVADASSGIRIGSNVAGYRFYRDPTGGSAGLLQFYGAQSGYTGYIFGGVDGERLRIDSNGQLGLGTASPDYSAGFVFATTNGASGSGLHAQFNGTTVSKIEGVTTGTNITAEGARNIQLYTNSTERARIDSSGNFGLGVTPSAWGSGPALQVGGISVASRTALPSLAQFSANQYWDGAVHRYIASDFATIYTQNAGNHIWSTAPSGTAGNVASLTVAMWLNPNGALALLGASTSANGVGITFPATQSASSDANTLDDYEEGTWTPRLSGSGGGDYTPSGINGGRYVKIGKMVFVTASLQWSAVVTPFSGNLAVTGLPFTCTSAGIRSSGSLGAVSSGIAFTAGYSAWDIVIDPGATFFYIIQQATSGSGYAHNPTVSSTGLIYAISLVYETLT
jgi:hypothetical protein